MDGKLLYIGISAVFGVWLSISYQWFVCMLFILYVIYIFKRQSQIFVFFMLLTFCFFIGYTFMYQSLHQTKITSETTKFVGEITSIPNLNGDRLRFYFKENEHNEVVIVSYRLSLNDELKQLEQLRVGMFCKLNGQLVEQDEAKNFYGFNSHEYLGRQNIHWILEPSSIQAEWCVSPSNLEWSPAYWRQLGIKKIEEHFDQPSSGIVQALIFGERSNLLEEMKQSFQQFGIIHLLAISGLHVSLLTTALFFLLIRLGLTRERAYTVLLCMLPLYILIAGAAPSVVRAGLMTMCVMVSIRFQYRFTPVDSISVVALIMMLTRPYYVFDVGFQLSFLVSLSLIISSASLLHVTVTSVKKGLYVTLIAQLMTLPIILYNFFEISILSIPLNLLFVPLMSLLILPLSFLTFILLYIFPPITFPLLFLLNKMLMIANDLLSWLQSFDFFTITFGRPPIIWSILFFLACIYFLAEWENSNFISKAWCSLSFLGLMLLFLWHLPYIDPSGEVTVLNVGQAECIYIEMPFRKTNLLIDTGGRVTFQDEKWKERKNSFQIGEDIVLPFLKAKGVRSIDRLMFTHGDFDHIGDAHILMNNLKIDKLLIGAGAPYDKKWQEELLLLAEDQGITVERVRAGESWKDGGINFYILSPFGDEKERNERSVVLWAKLGEVKWLFTGDLEMEGEERLMLMYPHLEADILKVGHHGSNTSSSSLFLERLNVKVALISVGEGNYYGHPHKEVLERFEKNGIRVFRTDRLGDIQWSFSKKRGTFRTVIPYDTLE
ncbi:DNA internalization-related competence protein ComEC/Rec2 [Bacillus solimangrovi]|uniref:DNA internalization-related competence protein ComEC/Rec2 n=1 Tax=Bacillus solimangrovi TaxID=1305675 RepID=A0A1E5LHZ3_9BACI|nr:DNA internalization-related competence protein ComEC/Rec2 [Bacillus solimangrovi]OEH93681.1 DNA internalization-related competence protein ComEC/Rec2 [Bacillus solimangrovi]